MSTCWVITDGAAGNLRQASALAERLAPSPRILTVRARAPWSWLAPHLTLAGQRALPPAMRSSLAAPWPALAIGCGRTGALFTRLLRTRSRGACRSVQILDPRADPRHWDLVIAPAHDALHGANLIRPLGSLNPINDAWLDAARTTWASLQALPSPRVGVLIGGPRHGAPLDDASVDALITQLRQRQQREGGSLMVVTSRRTPEGVRAHLAQALVGIPGLLWCGDSDGTNPFAGVLAWADRLVVTADSVNMLCEACAVGCPVHAPQPSTAGKLQRLHDALRQRGLLHELDAEPPLRQTPLRETETVAAEVARRLALHD